MTEPVDLLALLVEKLLKDHGFKFSAYVEKFRELENSLERINFIYNDMKRCGSFPVFKQDIKNDAEAIKLRENGNAFYKEGKYRDALDCYTQSILNAKSNEVLSLAYGNRSTALLKLNLCRECLQDINRAFENGYPDNLKSKLITRQKFAKKQKTVDSKFYEPIPKFPESEKNPKIQCARSCIKITKNEKYGRHIVATRKIEIGEILAVESPYSIIIDNEFYVHCHECLHLCYNLLPCDNCTKALYCSSTCKNKAFDSYHKYECPILLTLDSFKIDDPKRLALKTVFLGRNEWTQNNANLRNPTDNIYRSDSYDEITRMESHIPERNLQNILSRTVTACALFHLIENHTTFFQDYADNEDRLKENLFLIILVCGVNTVG